MLFIARCAGGTHAGHVHSQQTIPAAPSLLPGNYGQHETSGLQELHRICCRPSSAVVAPQICRGSMLHMRESNNARRRLECRLWHHAGAHRWHTVPCQLLLSFELLFVTAVFVALKYLVRLFFPHLLDDTLFARILYRFHPGRFIRFRQSYHNVAIPFHPQARRHFVFSVCRAVAVRSLGEVSSRLAKPS